MVLSRVLPFALFAALACSSGTEPTPLRLAHGIVAGNHQSAIAGSTQLTAPVVEQLVRTPTGQLSLRRVKESWGARALDLVVPRAFAQGTVVEGSPVAGAVVCAVSTDAAHALVPFTPCTNTGADGKATFFFTPGTGAGEATAEIRGTVANEPAVFDTAKATVLPGPVAVIYVRKQPNPAGGYYADGWHIAADGSLDLHQAIYLVRDAYGNTVAGTSAAADGTAQAMPDSTTWTPAWDVCVANQPCAPQPRTTSWTVTPPASVRSFDVYLFGTPTSTASATFFTVIVQ